MMYVHVCIEASTYGERGRDRERERERERERRETYICTLHPFNPMWYLHKLTTTKQGLELQCMLQRFHIAWHIHIYVHSYTYTYIYTCTHTYIYIYIYIYTHIIHKLLLYRCWCCLALSRQCADWRYIVAGSHDHSRTTIRSDMLWSGLQVLISRNTFHKV